jgi:hypothetical protein
MMTTPSLPSFGDALRTAASRVRRGSLRFLPAILVTWFLVEVVAAASGRPIVAVDVLGDALSVPTRWDQVGPR